MISHEVRVQALSAVAAGAQSPAAVAALLNWTPDQADGVLRDCVRLSFLPALDADGAPDFARGLSFEAQLLLPNGLPVAARPVAADCKPRQRASAAPAAKPAPVPPSAPASSPASSHTAIGGREYRVELRRKAAAYDALQAQSVQQAQPVQPGADPALLALVAALLPELQALRGELAQVKAQLAAQPVHLPDDLEEQGAADYWRANSEFDSRLCEIESRLDAAEQAGAALQPTASALGKRGGEARAASLTREQRSAAARAAVSARWAQVKGGAK